jgi:hypothetical protein
LVDHYHSLQEANPKLTEEKPQEPQVEEYDAAATEAKYLQEIREIMSKNKKMAKLGPKIVGEQARLLIDLGKALEKEGGIVDVQYWQAAKVWLEMGFSPKILKESYADDVPADSNGIISNAYFVGNSKFRFQ